MENFDVAVIGAGAAGMMCAAVAGQRGLRVVLIDHATRLAEKIRISGGGRCNFTNRDAGPANYLSDNPRFCRSALARYTPQDFVALVKRHRIAFHEKHKGQLFCDASSEQIIDMLVAECEAGRVQWRRPVQVHEVRRGASFSISTSAGEIEARALVVATGGLSIPKIGATDFAYALARQFGLEIVEPRPALVPLTFTTSGWDPFAALSGLALEASVSTGAGKSRGEFLEDLLLTHRGLSGPAILQISSFWSLGQPLNIDLLPAFDAVEWLLAAKPGSKKQLVTQLSEKLPGRLAETWAQVHGVTPQTRLADLPDRQIRALGEGLNRWTITPAGTEGWRKAEVTGGGVSTSELSSASLEAKRVPGLHFIGEAVDVTGWLGGYNFQWAWASAVAAAQALAERQ
ncbi:NAD(P)/FAD-dependent oxidoreductase [Pararobbsia silviterrae]|uniref:NAD(P)/FAD-dependent oxidoreductase n=1 Tax=Pararobbsia silviterrae TaxID=1792498 RepID=A0A494Y2K0_9BURK|nr:NAD(P)/FAD-dependent oxidoreductase [Pararobbsia silviterrae]RKP56509.1 NAD(P)/FAD-dependent oxidoreductase [Pararobbsia silviterrae]